MPRRSILNDTNILFGPHMILSFGLFAIMEERFPFLIKIDASAVGKLIGDSKFDAPDEALVQQLCTRKNAALKKAILEGFNAFAHASRIEEKKASEKARKTQESLEAAKPEDRPELERAAKQAQAELRSAKAIAAAKEKPSESAEEEKEAALEALKKFAPAVERVTVKELAE